MNNNLAGMTLPTCEILVNGQKRKLYGKKKNKVYLHNGDNFQLKLFNPLQERIGVQLRMNGIKVDNDLLILNPGQEVTIERYIGSNNKLKFSAYEIDTRGMSEERVQQAIKAIEKNGVLEVVFWNEKVAPPIISTVPNFTGMPTYITGGNSNQIGMPIYPPYTCDPYITQPIPTIYPSNYPFNNLPINTCDTTNNFVYSGSSWTDGSFSNGSITMSGDGSITLNGNIKINGTLDVNNGTLQVNQGTTGWSGTSGPSGSDGKSETSGKGGLAHFTGVSGFAGSKGVPGTRGTGGSDNYSYSTLGNMNGMGNVMAPFTDFDMSNHNDRTYRSEQHLKQLKKIETGRIEKGDHSNQYFNTTKFEVGEEFYKIKFKLLPFSLKPVKKNSMIQPQ